MIKIVHYDKQIIKDKLFMCINVIPASLNEISYL